MTSKLPTIELTWNPYAAPASPLSDPSPSAASPSSTVSRGVPEELRASLAGSFRSREINEAYIEQLKGRAEERAANARAIRHRSVVEGYASAATIMIVAATPPTDAHDAQAVGSSVKGSALLTKAQAAYRSNNGS